MRFPNRPHPLQSSRFWFMILACVAVTAMWKLGMFPGDSHQSGDFEEFAELDLSEDSGAFLADEDPTDSRGDASRDTSMTPPPGWASNALPLADRASLPLRNAPRPTSQKVAGGLPINLPNQVCYRPKLPLAHSLPPHLQIR